MQRIIKFFSHPPIAGTAVVLVAVAMLGQKVAPKNMPVANLESEISLIGVLGQALGSYMTVEANIVQAPGKTTGVLSVDKINGQGLKEPIIVPETEFSGGGGGGFGGFAIPQLIIGKRYQLRGIESAAFVGLPDDPERPKAAEARDRRQPAEKLLHVVPKFVITEQKDLGWITPPNADGNK